MPPTRVEAQVKASLEAGSAVFPQTGLVACREGVEGANSQMACDRLLPRGQHRLCQDLRGRGLRGGVRPLQIRRAAH